MCVLGQSREKGALLQGHFMVSKKNKQQDLYYLQTNMPYFEGNQGVLALSKAGRTLNIF